MVNGEGIGKIGLGIDREIPVVSTFWNDDAVIMETWARDRQRWAIISIFTGQGSQKVKSWPSVVWTTAS